MTVLTLFPSVELQDICRQLGISQRDVRTLAIRLVRGGRAYDGRFFVVPPDTTKLPVGEAWRQPVPLLPAAELDPSDYMSPEEDAADWAAFVAKYPAAAQRHWLTELPDRPEDVWWFDPDDRLVLARIRDHSGDAVLTERWVPQHEFDIRLAVDAPDEPFRRLLTARRALLARAKRGRPKGTRKRPPAEFVQQLPAALNKVRRDTNGSVTQVAVATELGMPVSTFLRELQGIGLSWQDVRTAHLPRSPHFPAPP